MLKDILLKGKGSGTPLFLAWTAGVFVAYGLLQASIFFMDTLNVWFAYGYFAVCVGLLAVWQAILLFPTPWRRTVWVLLCACVLLTVIFVEIKRINPPPLPLWLTFDWTTAALQTGVLLGARKRICAWIVALIVTAPLYPTNALLQPLEDAYSQFAFQLANEFANLLEEDFILSFEQALMMAKILVFGSVASFLMPPVESRSREVE
jgi:hypothetical protein